MSRFATLALLIVLGAACSPAVTPGAVAPPTVERRSDSQALRIAARPGIDTGGGFFV